MVQDQRASRHPDAGWNEWLSGDSGTAKTIISLRGEETFSINDYVFGYQSAGNASAKVALYDDVEGTAAGDLENQIGSIMLSPGATESITGISREDVNDDLLAVVSNNDAEVTVEVGGYKVTG
jgi:hypothetical protein